MTAPSKKSFVLVLKQDNPNLESVINGILKKTSKNLVKVLHPLPYKPHPTQPANYIPPSFTNNTYYYLTLSHSIVKGVLEKKFQEEMLDYEVQDKEDFEENRRERGEPKITKKLRTDLREKQEKNKKSMKKIQDLEARIETEKKKAKDALGWATIGEYAKFGNKVLTALDMLPENACPVTGVQFSFCNPPYRLDNCGHHVSYEAARKVNGRCPRCQTKSETYAMDLGGLIFSCVGMLASDLEEGKKSDLFKKLTSDDIENHYSLPLGFFADGSDEGEGQSRREDRTEPIETSDDE